jgi:hypothetical protein
MTSARPLAICALAAALAACAAPHDAAQHGTGDDPCAEYRALQGASPEARRAAAEAHIVRMHGSADPQHVERHLRMMEQRCRPASAPKG